MCLIINADFDLPEPIEIKDRKVFLATKSFLVVGSRYIRSFYRSHYYSFKKRETSLGLVAKKRDTEQTVEFVRNGRSLYTKTILGYHSLRYPELNRLPMTFQINVPILIPKESLQLISRDDFVSSNFILPKPKIIEKYFIGQMNSGDMKCYQKIYNQIKENGNVPYSV